MQAVISNTLSPPQSCFLTWGGKRNISLAVILLINVTTFVTLYVEHIALENKHDLCLFQSPKISTDSASPTQNTHLAVSFNGRNLGSLLPSQSRK